MVAKNAANESKILSRGEGFAHTFVEMQKTLKVAKEGKKSVSMTPSGRNASLVDGIEDFTHC